MYASMMTDELGMDLREALPIIKSWGYKYVDLRWRVFGCAMEEMPDDTAREVKRYLDENGMKVAMLHSSIGKVEKAWEKDVFEGQMEKARRIVSVAPILGANTVRMFPLKPEGLTEFGNLDENHPDFQKIIDLNEPIFRYFYENGLSVALENAAFHINDALNIVKVFSKYGAFIAWDQMGGWILRDQTEPVDDYFKRIAPYVKNIHAKAFALPQYRLHFEMGPQGATAGVLPWGKFMRALREAGSDGPISVETQHVLITKDKPSQLEANQWLAEFVLNVADS